MTGRRLLTSAGVALVAGLGAVAMVGAAVADAPDPVMVEIEVHYSRFDPSVVEVPAGRPVTFVITNTDPIDHEWILGDAALHERHRSGSEPVHDTRPTEVSLDAGKTRRTDVTFDEPGTL